MSTRQGNLKDYSGNKIAPNTCSAAVLDEARSQGLSASLLALVEKNALGYPTFSTTNAYAVDDKVFYDRKLWKFTSAHAAGAWAAADVTEFSVKEYMDALAARIVKENPALDLFITLGQGIYYGIANESMNKMKEMMGMKINNILTSFF